MGITRRILDSAQSGLSRLTSLVIVDDEELSSVDGSALQAELTARKAAREKSPKKPSDNPLAKQAGADPSARSARGRAANDRASRIHRERDEREARQRAASDEAFRRMKDQAARGVPPPPRASGGSSSSSSSSSTGRPPRPGSHSTEAQLAEWYKVLDIAPGSDLPATKSAYRKMMRKYHPDMHAGNPQKQKAATEMSMRVTSAYNGLMSHLDKK